MSILVKLLYRCCFFGLLQRCIVRYEWGGGHDGSHARRDRQSAIQDLHIGLVAWLWEGVDLCFQPVL